MKTFMLCMTILCGFGAITVISPSGDPKPAPVTRTSEIQYTIGEKVKASPYGDWLDGKIVAITSEDDYVVEYCGPLGWFNKWECEQNSLLRSQLAKTETN